MGHLAGANSDSRSDSNSRGDSNGRSNSSVSNTSNETVASNTSHESRSSHHCTVSNTSNETGSSHKASHCTVASEELGSGGGSCHKGGDTEGGLREKWELKLYLLIQEAKKLFYLHAVEGFDGMTSAGRLAAFKQRSVVCTPVHNLHVHGTRLTFPPLPAYELFCRHSRLCRKPATHSASLSIIETRKINKEKETETPFQRLA